MPTPPEPELQTSKVRPWLRGLAWVLPGICAPGFLLASFAFNYGSSSRPWIDPALLAGLAILVLACAFFETVLKVPTRADHRERTPMSIAKSIGLYCLVQLLLIPLIGTGTTFGCTVVLNLAN